MSGGAVAGTQFPADRRPVAGQDAVNGRAVILQISGGPLVLQIHQRLLHPSFIWSVADLLRGDYKQSEYGKVILPFTVLRRLDCVAWLSASCFCGIRRCEFRRGHRTDEIRSAVEGG